MPARSTCWVRQAFLPMAALIGATGAVHAQTANGGIDHVRYARRADQRRLHPAPAKATQQAEPDTATAVGADSEIVVTASAASSAAASPRRRRPRSSVRRRDRGPRRHQYRHRAQRNAPVQGHGQSRHHRAARHLPRRLLRRSSRSRRVAHPRAGRQEPVRAADHHRPCQTMRSISTRSRPCCSTGSRSSPAAHRRNGVRTRSRVWSTSSSRRTYEGLEATAQYGMADAGDYKEYRAGLLYGFKLGERTHVELAGDYVKNDGHARRLYA